MTMPRPSLVTSSGPSPVRGFMAAMLAPFGFDHAHDASVTEQNGYVDTACVLVHYPPNHPPGENDSEMSQP